MAERFTNLRELIPKWRLGNYRLARRKRGHVGRGDFVVIGRQLCKVVGRAPEGVVYHEVDIEHRRLRAGFVPSIISVQRLRVVLHAEGGGY